MHKIIAAFADFRYEQSASISFDTLTSKEHCSWTLDHWSQPKILDSVSPILEEDCKSISPFKIGFIKETSLGAVPDTMRTEVLRSLSEGFKSGYRGAGHFLRNFSGKFTPEDEKTALEAMDKETKKGLCIGPFNICPFPNTWCKQQAMVQNVFSTNSSKTGKSV